MSGALVVVESAYDVATAVRRIADALRERGVRLFATIDHAAGARDAGLDLPLRLLVWSDAGTTRLAFRDPHALADDFAVADRAAVLDALRGLLHHLVAVAAAPSDR